MISVNWRKNGNSVALQTNWKLEYCYKPVTTDDNPADNCAPVEHVQPSDVSPQTEVQSSDVSPPTEELETNINDSQPAGPTVDFLGADPAAPPPTQ